MYLSARAYAVSHPTWPGPCFQSSSLQPCWSALAVELVTKSHLQGTTMESAETTYPGSGQGPGCDLLLRCGHHDIIAQNQPCNELRLICELPKITTTVSSPNSNPFHHSCPERQDINNTVTAQLHWLLWRNL
jgi:hypothetical protein